MKIDPKVLLEALRPQPDTLRRNEYDEVVWLKQVTREESTCGYGHLTECCLEEDPCEWHASFPHYLRGQMAQIEEMVPGEGPIQVKVGPRRPMKEPADE